MGILNLNRPVTATGRLSAATVLLLLLPALFAPVWPAEAGGSRAPTTWASSSSGLPTTTNYFGVTFGDVNGDGRTDIVAGSDGSGLRVFLGDGAGTWTPATNQPSTTGGYSDVHTGDLDNDGKMDIVAGSPGNGASTPTGIHIYKGDGTGNFTEITAGSGLPTTGRWRGIALADVNKDGKLDIGATSGYGSSFGIHTYTGDGTGKFADNSTGLPGNQDRDTDLVFADFNRDGNPDIAAGGSSMPNVSVFLGNGGAGGAMAWTTSSAGLPSNVRITGVNASDFDNDGAPDLLISSYNGFGGVGARAYRNVNNAASWSSCSTGLPTTGNYVDVSGADFDLDGYTDMLISGVYGTKGMKVYYGNGGGTWTENSTGLPSADEFVGNEAGDFNGDGVPDILFGSYSGKGVLAYRNMATRPPALELTYPLTNFSWSGGSQHTVSWNVTAGFPPYNITLNYSTDGGATYPYKAATVQQAVPGPNPFLWTVPMVNSTAVRIRLEVQDGKNRSTARNSTANFEIDSTPPDVAATEPANGAVNVSTGTTVKVRFSEAMNRTAAAGAVAISGPATPSLASPAWTANEVVFQALGLQIGSAYTVTVSTAARDDSDPGNGMTAPFTFTFNTSAVPVPTISVGAPAGGEVWVAGTRQNITWYAGGGTGALAVSLDYSTAGPSGPWTAMAAGETNDGTYDWTVPDAPSANCYVRATVTDAWSPPKNASDVSDAPFTIKTAPAPIVLTVTAPKGGELWVAGTRQNITWTAAGGNGPLNVTLEYSMQGTGGPWNPIAANESNDGLYEWTVPDRPTAQGYIRTTVTDGYSPPQTASDVSDAPFTIRRAPVPIILSLTTPAGGENWTAGTLVNITWKAVGGTGTVTLTVDYSTAGPAGPWKAVEGGKMNPGGYTWFVPSTPSADCYVRLTATDSDTPPVNASAVSGRFTITVPAPFVDTQPPSVAITAPADGSTVNGTTRILVTATDNVGVVRVEILVDGVVAGNLTAFPFALDWDTKALKGKHTITARARDAAGNVGNAAPVTVTVKQAVPAPVGQKPFMEQYGLAVLLGVVLAAALGGAVAVVLQRRKKPDQPQAAPQPPAPQQYPPPQGPPQYPPPQGPPPPPT